MVSAHGSNFVKSMLCASQDLSALSVVDDQIGSPTPAKRPANSRLDCGSTKLTFDIDRPIWKNDLKEILQDLGEIQ